jgi:hypothetical protein
VYLAFCFSFNWIAYSPGALRFLEAPCCPGGVLFLSKYFALPRIGSPNLLQILVFGPVYLAIIFLFDFLLNDEGLLKNHKTESDTFL